MIVEIGVIIMVFLLLVFVYAMFAVVADNNERKCDKTPEEKAAMDPSACCGKCYR